MKRSILFFQTIFFLLLFFVSASSANGYVAGGVAKASLSPATASIPVGQTSTVKVMFNTLGVKISGVSLKLSFTSTANDLELVSAVKDSTSGLTFPFEPVVTSSGGVTTIVIEAIDFSTSGYSNSSNTPLATLTLKANTAFTGRAIQFSQADSKILDKAEAKDILGSLTNGTYAGTTVTTTVTTTPTVTETVAPTATVTTTVTTTPTVTETVAPTATVTTSPTATVTETVAPTSTPTIALNTPTDVITEAPQPTSLPSTGFSLPILGVLSGGVLITLLGLLFIL